MRAMPVALSVRLSGGWAGMMYWLWRNAKATAFPIGLAPHSEGGGHACRLWHAGLTLVIRGQWLTLPPWEIIVAIGVGTIRWSRSCKVQGL